ncbi:MAG: hypothetical protein K5860_04080 [Bacteroidales bacterium]|nr:hypothetical protein [Bacteroidales bacterium]
MDDREIQIGSRFKRDFVPGQLAWFASGSNVVLCRVEGDGFMDASGAYSPTIYRVSFSSHGRDLEVNVHESLLFHRKEEADAHAERYLNQLNERRANNAQRRLNRDSNRL